MPQRLKKLLLITLLCGLLLLPLTVYAAQEETTPEAPVAAETTDEEVPEGPIGLSSLVFLLGAMAIVTVGGLSIARNNFNEETSAA